MGMVLGIYEIFNDLIRYSMAKYPHSDHPYIFDF
jgi:hypothetical protein